MSLSEYQNKCAINFDSTGGVKESTAFSLRSVIKVKFLYDFFNFLFQIRVNFTIYAARKKKVTNVIRQTLLDSQKKKVDV